MPITPALSFTLILVSMLLYGLVHSLLASLGFKAQVQSWLGERGGRIYRLFYNLFAFVSLLPVLALPALLPDRPLYAIPFPWLLITLALQGLAVVALLLGLLQTGLWSFLGLSQLNGADPTTSSSLVVHGLYRWVRHPLYSAGLVFIWFAPRMTTNLLAFNMGATVYLIVGAWFEERKLLREFGQEYARYRARTPMLVPWLKFK
ncbi:MAG: isoprenylcysteine carboxylmethyltransferase family protein [Anaerolineales bacterium]